MESIEWILKAPAAIKVIKYSQDKSVAAKSSDVLR